MSGPAAPRRPDRAALVIAAALAVLAVVIFWKTRAMPVTAQYARVGPTTFPYVIAAVPIATDSPVSRAIGVTMVRSTGEALVRIAPTMT